MLRAETLGDMINRMIPGALVSKMMPSWPPDVFCVCAAVIQCSGAYSLLVENKPIQGNSDASIKRAGVLADIGASWRVAAGKGKKSLPELEKWWAIVIANIDCKVSRIAERKKCASAILSLLGAADEACHSLGLFFPAGGNNESDDFATKAELILLTSLSAEQGSTLCMNIHPSHGRVLPKMHTPQSGLTVRSLSHHLAYCSAPDICPQWLSAGVSNESHSLNLLLMPWPARVDPSQFKATRKVNVTDHVEGGSYGLFTYEAGKGPTRKLMKDLLDQATEKVGRIDGIIFPELALSNPEFNRIAGMIDEDCFLVSGVGVPASGPNRMGKNEAAIHVNLPLGDSVYAPLRFMQKKHHRWKLTKSQIVQYGIGHNLNPNTNWWEHIGLSGRKISFVTTRPWLTMSVLICEDLARPDPVGDILRAVGPNLIIALLRDGPQLIGRWPGRYAGAFADDPGSSVLTITSAGMAKLSHPSSRETTRSKTIALWRDAKSGAQELELPEGASALVLNLAVEYHEEWTADGRRDNTESGYPVLAGYHPIFSNLG